MFKDIDFSKMGNILEEAQKQMEKMQEESSSKVFTAKSGAGMVSVSVNGSMEIIDINFDNSLLEDKSSLQILLISACNDALKMAEEDKKRMSAQMLSGFGIK